MDLQELRDGLMAIGLTQYESDAYAALLELGSARAVDVARTADVPRARIYDVVRSLAEKGYVETFDDGSLHARAIDPSEVIEELSAAADHLESTAAAVERRWEEPAIENRQISVVKRFETLLRVARERIDRADFEIKVAVTPEQYVELEDALAAAREDGVVVKVTLHGGDSRAAGGPDELSALLDGEPGALAERDELRDLLDGVPTETRVRDLPTSLLVVIDHREVIFAPSPGLSAGDQGLFFDDVWFAEMADWFFRTALWAVWEPIQSDRVDPPAAYTDIRECLRSIGPVVDAGGRVRAAVTPIDDLERRIEGEVVDVTYREADEASASSRTAYAAGPSSLEPYVAVASLTLSTDDGSYEVGNWDAVVEDVKGGRITVLEIEEEEDRPPSEL